MSKRPTSDVRTLSASRPEGRSAGRPSGPKTGKRIRGVRVPCRCRCSSRARHVMSSSESLGLHGCPAPAVLAHRSVPAGLAAPEGAALLDPKAALTWLSPPVPLAPSRSPPEGDRAGFALRCPLAARRRPRCTGDRTARRRVDRVPGPAPGPKTERTSCLEAGDSLPGGRCPWVLHRLPDAAASHGVGFFLQGLHTLE